MACLDNGMSFNTKEELSSHEKRWEKLKCIFLSKRSPSGKGISYSGLNGMVSWKRQNDKKIKRSVVAREMRGGEEINKESKEDL